MTLASRADGQRPVKLRDKRCVRFAQNQQQQQQKQQATVHKHKTIYVYNAIKLTNYFTNLLNQQTQPKPKMSISGEHWRNKQLAEQIPEQDVQLLSSLQTTQTISNEPAKSDGEPTSAQHPNSSVDEEIRFIQSQRQRASQFRASLYYLNPTQQQQVRTSATESCHKAQSQENEHHRNNHQQSATKKPNPRDPEHCCFKCKKPIESRTTCIRVDNLQLAAGDRLDQQTKKTATTSERKSNSSQKNNGQTDEAIQEAILQAQKTPTSVNSNNNNNSNQKATTTTASETENKKSIDGAEKSSSCDEGLGSGSSSGQTSGQSSAATSHCDDRETPPHLNAIESELRKSGNSRDGERIEENPLHCDNLELSIDSLSPHNDDDQFASDSLDKHTREGDKTSTGKNSTRKSRTMTWSASLNSLGATFGFGGNMKCKSETDLKDNGASDVQAIIKQTKGGQEEDQETQTIYFHTDCFSCVTCNEVLVDLRALIYINEPRLVSKHQSVGNPSAGPLKVHHSKSDCEYVNLPNDNDDTRKDDENQNSSAGIEGSKFDASQISQELGLYCHRHFVELFKPRCQQCDCLILDEECTEAEGKVWHIKHFCCTECKVPLGGHQYIIVDQALNQARMQQQQQRQHLHKNSINGDASADGNAPDAERNNRKQQQNSPYCLKCFDRIFGETCEFCAKLITCDSGAINHEQRCWHASPDCFKCFRCQKSLLGAPFLPNQQDNKIYCSIQCSNLSNSDKCQQKSAAPVPNQLSVAHYSDPRAARTPAAHLTLFDQTADQAEHSASVNRSALRHNKPLIDYLLSSARNDDTSYQLLKYLYGQLSRLPGEKSHESGANNARQIDCDDEAKLICQIGNTLKQIEFKQSEAATNCNRPAPGSLNPFLNFSTSKTAEQQTAASGGVSSKSVEADDHKQHAAYQMMSRLMMDRMRLAAAERRNHDAGVDGQAATEAGGRKQQQQQQLVNYINLDNCLLSRAGGESKITAAAATKTNRDGGAVRLAALDTVDNSTVVFAHHIQTATGLQQQKMFPIQAKTATSIHHPVQLRNNQLNSSGNQQQQLLSQCSPVASLISNEGTISDHSAASSSGVSTAPPIGSSNGSLKSHSPLSSSSSHSSVSSSSTLSNNGNQANSSSSSSGRANQTPNPSRGTGEHQRTSSNSSNLPMINSIAATLERRRRVQPITELSVVDLLTVADDQMQQQHQDLNQPPEGFNQLVSHFESNKHRVAAPPSLATNQSHVQRSHTISGLHGFVGQQMASTSGKQQPDSFFHELAQRLPRGARTLGEQAMAHNPSVPLNAQVATQQMDTNGLPTVDSIELQQQQQLTTTRTVTDYYSTVNKANKRQQQQQMAAGGGAPAATSTAGDMELARDKFFAITSPLLGCQTDSAIARSNQQQVVRPNSSLSLLSPVGRSASGGEEQAAASFHQPSSQMQHSYSTSSLHQLASNGENNLLVQPIESVQQQQKPLTRPAKSVSFDPNVKDPPSSGSMTLGRASGLKSALKQLQQQQPSLWDQQQQLIEAQAFNCSSATMPASLASQMKQMSSLKAYNAHYDEQGRRIKLSTLMQQQLLMQQLERANMNLIEQQQQQQLQQQQFLQPAQPQPSGSRSLLSGALSKLSGGSSSGGRREERKMRQNQQQNSNQLAIMTQPQSTMNPVFSELNPHLQPLQQQHQPLFVQDPSVIQQEAASSSIMLPVHQQHRGKERRSHTRTRKQQSRSVSSTPRRRDDSRHGRKQYRSKRRRNQRGSSRRSGHSHRYCCDDDYSDADYSSCSTCSSSASSSSDESASSDDETSSSASSSSSSSYEDYSDEDYSHSSDDNDSMSSRGSSYTSYTSYDEQSCQSTSSSDAEAGSSQDELEPKAMAASPKDKSVSRRAARSSSSNQQASSSQTSSSPKESSGGETSRSTSRHRAPTSTSGRSSGRQQRASSRSNSTKSSVSSSSGKSTSQRPRSSSERTSKHRSVDRRNIRHTERRSSGEKRQRRHSRSSRTSHDYDRENSRRGHHRSQQQQRSRRRRGSHSSASSRHHHHDDRSSRVSSKSRRQTLNEPQQLPHTFQMIQPTDGGQQQLQQTASMVNLQASGSNFGHLYPQRQQAPMQLQRARSPSSVCSSDSKKSLNRDEKDCRII